ncbi:hypothetical protein PV08_03907 [Exophiala spinifera]|uniref:Uncharacterized protein n=1 Tax=Exophiala spinifera TaxID=91928 RepID=A0A0D2BCL3_9EURO|nr:uncharacterized protein PV08_03907 [Exophiala spinifera]KIW16718.1 hypothetical protein PV08_03907 [Exophiala spinifera]
MTRPSTLNIVPKVYAPKSRPDRQVYIQGYPYRHDFHTIAPLAVSQGHKVHSSTAKLANRSPPLPPPPPSAGNVSLPPAPIAPSLIGVSRGPPALGNRRKAGISGDDKRSAPHNPSQEMRRQKDLEEAFSQLQDRIAQAILRLDRFDQELTAWKDNDVIGKELHLARRDARQQYIQDLAVTRAKDLVLPLETHMNSICYGVDTIGRDLASEYENMRAYRRQLVADMEETVAQLENMHREDSVDVLLQESGHLFSDLTRMSISASDLIGICEGLQNRGLWESNEDVRFWREYSPMGGKTPRIKHALTEMIDLRPKLDINAGAISLEVHILRKIRRSRLSYARHPELFQHLFHDLKFYITLNQIASSSSAIFHEARNFGFWVHSSFSVKTSRKVYRRWSDIRLWLLITKIARGASTLKEYYWSHLRGFKLFVLNSNSLDLPLQLAQVSDFGPFTVCLFRFNDILKLLNDFKADMETFRKFNPQFENEVEQRPALSRFLENREWFWKATHTVRSGFWRDLEAAVHWKTVANLCLGLVPRPVSRSLMRVPEDLDSVDQGPAVSHVPVVGFIDHRFQPSGYLYPQGSPVPVKYITSLARASTVVRDLSKNRVVALDLIMKDASEARPVSSTYGALRALSSSGRLPFDFVVITTKNEVAIFDIAYLGPIEVIWAGLFEPILDNESILKVGFNIEHQKRLLSEYLFHRLTRYHDLRLQSPNHIGRSPPPIDPSLAGKSSGAYSQKSDFAKDQGAAPPNPSRFFHNLASTGFAALRMYDSACKARHTGVVSSTENGGQSLSLDLGPVLIYADTRPPVRTMHRELSLPYVERKRTLLSLGRAMAKTMYENDLHTKDLPWLAKSLPASVRQTYVEKDCDLHAYVLFTTFHENLETIARYLEVEDVVSRILAAAERYQLPLLDIDRTYLTDLRGFSSAPSTEIEVVGRVRSLAQKKSSRRRRGEVGSLSVDTEAKIDETLNEEPILPGTTSQTQAAPHEVSPANLPVSMALKKKRTKRTQNVARRNLDDMKDSPKKRTAGGLTSGTTSTQSAAPTSPKERKMRIPLMPETGPPTRFSSFATATTQSPKRRTTLKSKVPREAKAEVAASPDSAGTKSPPRSVLFSPLWTKAKDDVPRESGQAAASSSAKTVHKTRHTARKAGQSRLTDRNPRQAFLKRTGTSSDQARYPPSL